MGDSVFVSRHLPQHRMPAITASQIFRTWVVYEYNWMVIILPILLMIGDTVCGWGITWAESTLTTGAYTSPIVEKWMKTYIVLALSLNLTCTGALSHCTFSATRDTDGVMEVLITARILKVSRTSADAGITGGSARALKKVLRIIVESGLIYTIHSLLFLIVSCLQSNALYPVADSVSACVSSGPSDILNSRAVDPHDDHMLPPGDHSDQQSAGGHTRSLNGLFRITLCASQFTGKTHGHLHSQRHRYGRAHIHSRDVVRR
jgi:hypothetical protein